MNISQIMEKMIAFSNGNLHDMNHLMCVWTYAKTIGELEGLDRKTQETLDAVSSGGRRHHARHCLPALPREIRQHQRKATGGRGRPPGTELSGGCGPVCGAGGPGGLFGEPPPYLHGY